LQVGRLKPEKAIPAVVLKQARGLAIVTVANVGMMVTYKIGTGLVVARRADGSWSPPSAISTCGIGYGAQVTSAILVFFTWGICCFIEFALSNNSKFCLIFSTSWR
jgi:SH3 domain-containing YSC84-like protein 1